MSERGTRNHATQGELIQEVGTNHNRWGRPEPARHCWVGWGNPGGRHQAQPVSWACPWTSLWSTVRISRRRP